MKTKQEFKSVEFFSAREKELTAKQFLNFVKKLATLGDCESTKKAFTKRVYEHLHLHCGFIAHYDINGFYVTYFNGDLDDYKQFAEHFIEDGEISPYHYTSDYNDINFVFAKILSEKHSKILANFSEETKENDLAQAQRLVAKWN